MSEFPCPTCDRVFDSQRGRRIHHHRAHDGRFPNRTCAACGSKFYCEYEKKYCSSTCREQGSSNWGSNNPNYKGGKTVGTCDLCDATFEYYPSEKEGRYCSECVQTEDWQTPPTAVGEDNPRWNGGKRQVDCVICDTTVERYPSNIGEVVVCSEACRRDWLSKRFSGSKHPNWNGGGNPEYGTGWNEVRRNALERDGHRCLVCGSTREELGRNPDVHHIVPVRWFIESDDHTLTDAHFLDNVASLCSSCHRKAEYETISRDELRAIIGAE
ncbi:HNH endonuclease [Haladaptatus sp. NG-SE-30]